MIHFKALNPFYGLKKLSDDIRIEIVLPLWTKVADRLKIGTLKRNLRKKISIYL